MYPWKSAQQPSPSTWASSDQDRAKEGRRPWSSGKREGRRPPYRTKMPHRAGLNRLNSAALPGWAKRIRAKKSWKSPCLSSTWFRIKWKMRYSTERRHLYKWTELTYAPKTKRALSGARSERKRVTFKARKSILAVVWESHRSSGVKQYWRKKQGNKPLIYMEEGGL